MRLKEKFSNFVMNVINQNVSRSYKFQKSYQLSSYRYYFSIYFTDSEYFI